MNKILNDFQQLFNKLVLSYLNKKYPANKLTEPILYTLKPGRNRFRPCTALIAGKICGSNINKLVPIAAISELVHTVIIAQDDIADNDNIRRGKTTAWKKFGKIHTIFSCNYVLSLCADGLEKLSCKHQSKEKIISLFWQGFKNVGEGQIMQATLKLESSIDPGYFKKMNTLKAGEGIWAIQAGALFAGRIDYAKKFIQYAQKLGEAGMIKNDIEDIFLENDYDSFFCDIREGIVTYPIHSYYQKCNRTERKRLQQVFGQQKINNQLVDYFKKDFLKKRIVENCRLKIDQLTSQAICNLAFIPFQYTKEKQQLTDWANNHRI